ncbi:uncharacterized protein LOC134239936 [Saccostrea cucullata]|uniref:uncharacterized protein LOC134239936 n=1 Tax=Saccostrea cuccullata TaxID=36930 RepID=UPI002ED2F832
MKPGKRHIQYSDEFNLTGSLPAAILEESFTWTCAMFLPPREVTHAVSFSRNNTRIGSIGYMNGKCLTADLNPRYIYLCESENVFSLVIPSENMTEYEANTTWRCQHFSNGFFKSPEVMLKIGVFVQNVTIIPVDSPLTLREETKLTVTCSVNNNAYPPPTIQWYIGDTLVNMTGRNVELIADRDIDGKVLLCIATNNNKSLSASTVLNILYKPIINIAPSPLLTVNLGETVSVNCVVVKSNPTKILEYAWSILGQERIIGRESDLTIFDASLKDNGTFQCSARNSVGTSKLSFVTVIVRMVPPRPQYVKALCCDTHADIVWVTLLSGHVEQKSFIQFRESHSTFSNTTTGLISTQKKGLYTARVNDLLDNIYIFRVITVNQYGSVNSINASCRVQENQGQSAPNVSTTVGGTVGGLMVLILVVVTVIIILKRQRQHNSGAA